MSIRLFLTFCKHFLAKICLQITKIWHYGLTMLANCSKSSTLTYTEIIDFKVKMRSKTRAYGVSLFDFMVYDDITYILAHAIHEPLKLVFWSFLADYLGRVTDEWEGDFTILRAPSLIDIEKGSKDLAKFFIKFYTGSNDYCSQTPKIINEIFHYFSRAFYLITQNIDNPHPYYCAIEYCDQIQNFLKGKRKKL